MKKRARGKRRGRGRGTRRFAQQSAGHQSDAQESAMPPPVAPPPVLLSISPQGVTVPGGPGPSGDAARLRGELERHARDVEEFVRARRFEAIVTRVLADIERPGPGAPRLRLSE
jgi:hypothetical protein